MLSWPMHEGHIHHATRKRRWDAAMRALQERAEEFNKTQVGKTAGLFKVRHNQWRYVDFDGDGALDLIVAVEDWADYGWDDAWDANGRWTNGPLHGLVYLVHNSGSTDKPKYAEPVLLEADGQRIDTFGCPSPNFEDFDGDGDLDLLCGDSRKKSRVRPDSTADSCERRLGAD